MIELGFMLLARKTEAHPQTGLNIFGAGLYAISAYQIPFAMGGLSVVCSFRASGEDIGRPFSVYFELREPEGDPPGIWRTEPTEETVQRLPGRFAQTPYYTMLTAEYEPITFSHIGVYTVTVFVDDQPRGQLELLVDGPERLPHFAEAILREYEAGRGQ